MTRLHPEGTDRPAGSLFDLGGTSLSALKLVIALDRAVSFKELTSHPSLAAQATLLDARGFRAARATVPMGICAT